VAFDYVLARNSGPSKQSEQHPIQVLRRGFDRTGKAHNPTSLSFGGPILSMMENSA
ncbi:unnamed protein product, partial [Symbiodinium sp. KB8]